jgi:hypothetical protein
VFGHRPAVLGGQVREQSQQQRSYPAAGLGTGEAGSDPADQLLEHHSPPVNGAEWIHTPVRERASQAVLCLDPFHIVQWATKAIDKVRRGLWNTLRGNGNTAAARELKGTRWVVLTNLIEICTSEEIHPVGANGGLRTPSGLQISEVGGDRLHHGPCRVDDPVGLPRACRLLQRPRQRDDQRRQIPRRLVCPVHDRNDYHDRTRALNWGYAAFSSINR